jgi:hypothetical protein
MSICAFAVPSWRSKVISKQLQQYTIVTSYWQYCQWTEYSWRWETRRDTFRHVKYGGSRCRRESDVSIFLPQMQCRNWAFVASKYLATTFITITCSFTLFYHVQPCKHVKKWFFREIVTSNHMQKVYLSHPFL